MTLTMATLIVVTLSAQTAAQKCQTVEGSFVANITKDDCARGNFCTSGQLTGALKGTYTYVTRTMIAADNSTNGNELAPPTVAFFIGESTVTLENGRTLSGIDTGTIDQSERGGFASLITWTKGANGQLRLRGLANTKGTTGEYAGTVCPAVTR